MKYRVIETFDFASGDKRWRVEFQASGSVAGAAWDKKEPMRFTSLARATEFVDGLVSNSDLAEKVVYSHDSDPEYSARVDSAAGIAAQSGAE
jgi:hypothetical protein